MVMPTEPIPTPLAGENPTLEERLRELAKRVELSTGVFRTSPTLDQTRDTINLSREAADELARLRADVERLTAELEQLREEAREAPEEMREYVDDTRQFILRGFPELDRLGIAMLHQHAHEGEWNLPTLAQHLVERLAAAHTPVHEKPSEVVATRMVELRHRAEAAEARAERLEKALEDIAERGGWTAEGMTNRARRALTEGAAPNPSNSSNSSTAATEGADHAEH
jgi:hypothetical protein